MESGRVERRGEAGERSEQRAGETAEEHVARRQLGQGAHLVRRRGPGPSASPATSGSVRVERKCSNRIRAGAERSPYPMARPTGPVRTSAKSRGAGVHGRAPGQRVLDDDVVDALGAELAAQVLELPDGEPAVVGDHRRGGLREQLGQVRRRTRPCASPLGSPGPCRCWCCHRLPPSVPCLRRTAGARLRSRAPGRDPAALPTCAGD